MHRSVWCAPLLVMLYACGGGGGSPPPPLNRPDTLYVRTSGNDANDGFTPATALREVATAADHATPGDRITVGPGRYGAVNINNPGTAAQAITFFADSSGQLTGDSPDDVVLDAAGGEAAFKVSNKSHVIIDGFTLTGSAADNSTAGVSIKSAATDVIVRNCIVRDNLGQGIRVADASDVTIVNNLILNNGLFGIQVLGKVVSNQIQPIRVHVFNNTIFANGAGGITVGSTNRPAQDTMFINNIINANNLVGFTVFTGPPSSLDGLVERFNLNTDTYKGTTANPQSFNADPRFILPGTDFRLAQPPAQVVTSPAVDAGDPNTPDDIKVDMMTRTTTTSGATDVGRVDLGYHYPH